jgi:hypothetical protein
MAERLPRYRPLGVAIPSVPGVDFTRAAQAEGRVFETLSDALNKMSDFAFERQKAETIRKAEQYAFNNPVSKEQLEEAKKRGIDLDDVVGDPDTVFGATVRSTTGKIMSAQLETLYRKELAIIQRNMENPLYDPEDEETGVAAQTKKLAGLEQGYAEAIAEVDTDEAIAFKAGIAALGGSAYKSALEIRNKKISAGLMVVAEQSMDDLPANARATIASATQDETVTVDDALKNLRIGVEKTLLLTGNTDFIKSNSAAIDGVFQQAKIDILTNHALSEEFSVTDTQRDRKISTGDFGRYSTVFASLGAKEQAQVRQNVRTEKRQQDETLERVRRDNVRVFQEEVSVIVRDTDGATDDQFNAAIGELYRISSQTAGEAITFQAIEALKKERDEGTPSNPSGNVNLALAIAKGQVTIENFPEAREHFGVTYKDALSMVSKASAVDKNDLKQATLLARQAAGVLDELTTTYTSQQATQINTFMKKVEKEFSKQLADWKESGSPIGDRPTRMAIARDIETLVFNSEVQKQIDAEIQAANDRLQGISNFPITESTTEAEIDTMPFNPSANLSDDEMRTERTTLKSQLRKIRDLIAKRNELL